MSNTPDSFTADAASAPTSPELAVIVSRYPKINDMYQLREILTLEKLGMPIELYSLIHHNESVSHPEGAELEERCHFGRPASLDTLRAHAYWLRRNPRGLARSWWWSLTTMWRSREFFTRTFWIIPVAAVWARDMERNGILRTHAHFATFPTHAAMIIKWLAGIPYAFTGHAHDIHIDTTGLERKIAEADYVMTCTHHSRNVLAERYGAAAAEKINVVYHGLETDVLTPRPAEPYDGDRPLRIMCMATFMEYKGHRYLLEAVSTLRAGGRAVELALLGDGPDRETVEGLVEQFGLTDVTTFTGRVASPQVREWIEWSDICALASVVAATGQVDGIPNFLTEAMAMGRSVVATSLPGISELVVDGTNGLLAPPRDAAAFAAALEKMAADGELRARCIVEGRRTVELEHDVVENTKRCYEIYRAALDWAALDRAAPDRAALDRAAFDGGSAGAALERGGR